MRTLEAMVLGMLLTAHYRHDQARKPAVLMVLVYWNSITRDWIWA